MKDESHSFLPQHNCQYLDAAYWDDRFQKVLSAPKFSKRSTQ